MPPMYTVVTGQGPKVGTKVDINSGFGLPSYNEVQVTYPTTVQEVYTFKQSGQTVGTITVNYTDTTKVNVSSVLKS